MELVCPADQAEHACPETAGSKLEASLSNADFRNVGTTEETDSHCHGCKQVKQVRRCVKNKPMIDCSIIVTGVSPIQRIVNGRYNKSDSRTALEDQEVPNDASDDPAPAKDASSWQWMTRGTGATNGRRVKRTARKDKGVSPTGRTDGASRGSGRASTARLNSVTAVASSGSNFGGYRASTGRRCVFWRNSMAISSTAGPRSSAGTGNSWRQRNWCPRNCTTRTARGSSY